MHFREPSLNIEDILKLITQPVMRIAYYSLLIFFVISSSYSCGYRNQTEQKQDISSVKKIKVNEISKDEIPDMMVLDSYIPLSNDFPIGRVIRVIIYRDRIYILDNEPKIICFNMQGKMLFKIDCRGAGPTDYQNIKDFAIDGNSKRIVAFDNEKRKLFFYELNTGENISSISTQFMAPTEIGVIDGSFFFKNIDTRFDVQKEHMFYLLYSKGGKQIDKTFLPHDAVASFNFDLNSFFYNEENLLFIRPFDNTVYVLDKEQITPVFEILLPNPLPMKNIEEKIRHVEIPTSGYSYGVGDVYTTGKTVHFTFSKDGYVVSNFFDSASETLLYSGMRVLGNSRKQLPFYSLIDGVYKNKFFSLVSASSIVERRTANAKLFPKELLKIKEDDNHILAFFTFE